MDVGGKFTTLGYEIVVYGSNLHLGGGVFYINGDRWYDTILIDIVGEPYNILPRTPKSKA